MTSSYSHDDILFITYELLKKHSVVSEKKIKYQNFNINNVNEVMIQTQKYIFFLGGRVRHINTVKRYKTGQFVYSVMKTKRIYLFSLFLYMSIFHVLIEVITTLRRP